MSLPRYPKYKDSGVEWLGEIPEHWEASTLKRMADVELSNIDKKTVERETPVRLCNYVDVYKNENITADLDFMAASASIEQIDRLTLGQGDVIITKDSETPDDIGVPAFVKDRLEGVVCGYHLAMLRMIPGVATGSYLARTLQSAFLRAQFATSAVGMTRFGLGKYEIENAIVPKPPMEEQSKIATFLDFQTAAIDALVEEQRRLIELLKEKRQAVISHAITNGLKPDAPMKDSGIEWLGKVPAHWDVKRIKYVLRKLEQGWSPQCESFPAEDGEWAVLKVGCVNGGRFNENENKALPPELTAIPELSIRRGDVLVSRANTRELVGSAVVSESDFPHHLLCDKLYRLNVESDLCLPEYLATFLSTPHARGEIELAATGASSSMVNIGQSTLTEMFMPLPPIAEQHEIATFITSESAKADELTAAATRAIDLLQERRAALISAAVTGKIDVRGMAKEQTA